MDLDQFDAEVAGPMWVKDGDAVVAIPPATEFHWRAVASACHSLDGFVALIWPPETPVRHWKRWKVDTIHRAWIRHNGLLAMPHLQRLIYMMERYADGIEYDLRNHLGLDAGAMWRDRRWRELMAYIDMLPTDSHKNRLLTNDEEHMEAILASQKGDRGDTKPSMANWGQLESMVAVLIDAVNRNTEVTHAVAQGKKKPLRIPPYPRPATAAEKVEHAIQKKKHEEMVALLLPGKRAGQQC